MKAFRIAIKEMFYRWPSSLMMIVIVAAITAVVSFFWTNRTGFTKEIKRNVRDIGSNVVILPATVDQVEYHNNGGYSEETMPYEVVEQLILFKASLNHLIPMLETRREVRYKNETQTVRVVGISASIPMPGRPKAPMQKAVKEKMVQVGFALAQQLGIDEEHKSPLFIDGNEIGISRVNKPSGTWQDSAVFLDLKTAQEMFAMPNQISRIDAIECTSEKCEELGVSSSMVLNSELVNITDKAQILRRQSMADARANLRNMSASNLELLTNAMWIFLVTAIALLAIWNSSQRKSEIGVFRAIGFNRSRILGILISRSFLLALVGSIIGVVLGATLSTWQSSSVFEVTGKKTSVDVLGLVWIASIAVLLAGLASLVPATLAASRHPAEVIGKDPV